jgi:hypothetical protein
MSKDNKVDKLRDHGYMDLGYSGFMNDVGMKKSGCPNQGRHGLLFQEKKAIKGDDKKAKYMLETKAFYNYQINKE